MKAARSAAFIYCYKIQNLDMLKSAASQFWVNETLNDRVFQKNI